MVTMQSHPISKWLKRPKVFLLEARCWPRILKRNNQNYVRCS
jgi:hypothetical protein